MKKIIVKALMMLSVIAFISGCSTHTVRLTDRDYEQKTFGIDFREYNEKGFLFFTEEYYGAYELLGMITIELYPEVNYEEGRVIEEHSDADDTYYSPSTTRLEIPEPKSGYTYQIIRINNSVFTQNIQKIHIDEIVNQLYELSIEMGGDAVSQFEAYQSTAQTDIYENTSYPYYTVSGLIIKRK